MDFVALRKKAEATVADMPDGEMKLKAFEVVYAFLLAESARPEIRQKLLQAVTPPKSEGPSSSIAERINLLASEAFFAKPRSLAEIQAALAAHGWHYPQTNLSTPLVRLVRQRRLRRLKSTEGTKRTWKYSLP
jgi:hypothetical protein